ncbi:MAG: CBS domain-containing protein [Methanobacteriaceae archaeon]|nr:CBS domain-containing protein [Methanobacteriaceae archaeon]
MKIDNNISISDAMTHHVIISSKETSISEIAKIMTDNSISCVVITDETKTKGIVTSTDIISKVVSKDIKSSDVTAEMVMSTDLISISRKLSVYDAATCMIKHHVKTLLVMEDEELIGIITSTDIINVSPELTAVFIEKTHLENQNFSNEENDYDDSVNEGVCEECGIYTDNLENINNKYVCVECIENANDD